MTTRFLDQWAKAVLVLALVAVGAIARLLPHPPNATPIAAMALLGGASLPFPWSVVLPMGAMLLSDLVIGFDSFPITLSVYGSFFATVLMGSWLRGGFRPWRILAASLGSSILFYLVTNAAVWKFSGMYPPTHDGLLLSYLFALPFFRNMLLGDLAYTTAAFTAFQFAPEFLAVRRRSLRTRRVPAITSVRQAQ